MNLDAQQLATAVVDRLRKDMNNLADDLASNNCKSMEDYRYVCGRILGLSHAEQYVKDLAKQMEDADE